jgi:hypothetical protein
VATKLDRVRSLPHARAFWLSILDAQMSMFVSDSCPGSTLRVDVLDGSPPLPLSR